MKLALLASKELKKHVGAIQIKGSLSLLQRKIANILLLNAYDDLITKDSHRIRVKDLAIVAGFESNNIQVLKDALESLVDLKIQWNILDEQGKSEWGVAPFIAGAKIKRGVCTYAYSPLIREKLYHPEIYARINLAIQRQFRSGYALSLYENCVRFRDVGSTGWIALEKWRELLGVELYQYSAFKSFSQRVLKPALKEVNLHSDIMIEVQYQREKRRVVALKFEVRDNPQLSLDLREQHEIPEYEVLPTRTDDESPLLNRLMTFGVNRAQAKKILSEYDHERIQGNLDSIEADLLAGKTIKNVPGYTVRAIKDDYRPKTVVIERQLKEREEEKKRKRRERETARKEEEEKQRKADEAERERLDRLYMEMRPTMRRRIDDQVLKKMEEEGSFTWQRYLKEKEEGKALDQMSIVVTSTFRNLRREIVKEMATNQPAPRS